MAHPPRIPSPLASLAALALALAPTLLLSAPAAAGTPPRVAMTVAGPGGKELRAAMVTRMKRHCQFVPSASDLSPAEQRRQRLAAVVDGRVFAGATWRVKLVVRNGQGPRPAGTLSWSSNDPGELMRDVLREAPAKVLALVGRGQPPATRRPRTAAAPDPVVAEASAEESAEETEAPAPDEASPPTRIRPRRAPWLEASAGPAVVGRSLTLTDNPSGAPGYSLPLAAAVAGELMALPLALPLPTARSGGPTADLGLALAGESSLAAETAAGQPGEAGHATRFLGYRAGVRGRLLFPSAALLVGLDYGEQRFDVDLPPEVRSPAVRYRFWRPSVTGRLALQDLRFSLTAAYLGVLSRSGWGDAGQFPRARVRGIEAGLRVGYALGDALELGLAGDVRRFAFSMNARAGDPVIVGGALDEYLSLALRLTWRLD